MTFLRTASVYAFFLVLSFALVEGIALTYQTIRLRDSVKTSNDLVQEISDMKAAEVLTDRLHEYNAEITQDQLVMGKELEVAKGYSDPLSPDILHILDRMYATPGTAAGVSR